MKKLIFPLLALLFLTACEKGSMTDLQPDQVIEENGSATLRSPAPMIDVCHYDAENNSWKLISINENALSTHEGHGDVQLIDEDGDGYVTQDNECMPTDCDDTDAELTDNCSTSCVDGEVEIDFNGPLFVAPADEPGFYNWQQAINQCNSKDTEGCDWFLPSKDELNALYFARNIIGGFDQSGGLPESFYWSSTEFNVFNSWGLDFDFGVQFFGNKSDYFRCRCVRR
jgi:hypothetical protein